MPAYNSTLSRTGDATNGVSILQPGSAMRRFQVRDLLFGYSGAMTDVGFDANLTRSTTAGTGGATPTPQAVDAGDPASVILNRDGAATNGTASGVVLAFAGNMRSTVRWVARDGDEIVVPGTAANGLHFLTPTTPTVAYRLCLRHVE